MRSYPLARTACATLRTRSASRGGRRSDPRDRRLSAVSGDQHRLRGPPGPLLSAHADRPVVLERALLRVAGGEQLDRGDRRAGAEEHRPDALATGGLARGDLRAALRLHLE